MGPEALRGLPGQALRLPQGARRDLEVEVREAPRKGVERLEVVELGRPRGLAAHEGHGLAGTDREAGVLDDRAEVERVGHAPERLLPKAHPAAVVAPDQERPPVRHPERPPERTIELARRHRARSPGRGGDVGFGQVRGIGVLVLRVDEHPAPRGEAWARLAARLAARASGRRPW